MMYSARRVWTSAVFLHMRMLRNKMSTVALCLSVSEGHAISEMAKILRVSGDCSREVLQEVGFDDRVDDVLMQRANCDDRHFLQS